MKKINTKNSMDKKPTAIATSTSRTRRTNCASLVSVSNNSNNSGRHNNHHSDSLEIRRGHLFCDKTIAHCVDGAVKFKSSQELDRYETLISSEVYVLLNVFQQHH